MSDEQPDEPRHWSAVARRNTKFMDESKPLNYMTKDEWQEHQRQKWRDDDEIRKSRQCKLS